MHILKKITQEKIHHQNEVFLVGQSLIKYDPYPYKDLVFGPHSERKKKNLMQDSLNFLFRMFDNKHILYFFC